LCETPLRVVRLEAIQKENMKSFLKASASVDTLRKHSKVTMLQNWVTVLSPLLLLPVKSSQLALLPSQPALSVSSLPLRTPAQHNESSANWLKAYPLLFLVQSRLQ
jgi:hypothetical protein